MSTGEEKKSLSWVQKCQKSKRIIHRNSSWPLKTPYCSKGKPKAACIKGRSPNWKARGLTRRPSKPTLVLKRPEQHGIRRPV
eukprot:1143266-Pelagomonas_calceolata.AAC.4